MEHEAIPNISSSRRIGGKSGGGAKPGSSQKQKTITVDTIIKEVRIVWYTSIVFIINTLAIQCAFHSTSKLYWSFCNRSTL